MIVITINRSALGYVLVLLDYLDGGSVDFSILEYKDVHQNILMMFFGGIAATFFWVF